MAILTQFGFSVNMKWSEKRVHRFNYHNKLFINITRKSKFVKEVRQVIAFVKALQLSLKSWAWCQEVYPSIFSLGKRRLKEFFSVALALNLYLAHLEQPEHQGYLNYHRITAVRCLARGDFPEYNSKRKNICFLSILMR